MMAVCRGPVRPIRALAALLLLGGGVLTGCGGGGPTPSPVPVKVFRVGLITNGTLVNDGGYNQATNAAVQQAQTELGAQSRLLEAQKPDDYRAMIDQLVQQKCDVIITVGPAQADV